MALNREQIIRLRHRHRGYLITLATEVALVLLLPLAEQYVWILSMMLVVLAVVLMGFVSRYSLLRKTRPVIYTFGSLAIGLEIFWHFLLPLDPGFAQLLALPHVLAWLIFLSLSVLRKIKTLTKEPYVTVAVVMGAASGYMLIGIAGGILLTALWALQPTAFNLSSLPPLALQPSSELAVAPALFAASFTLLTTVGTSVLNASHVSGQVVVNVITVVGQLYVAILISLILGRYHHRR